jgi:hypothetical protein
MNNADGAPRTRATFLRMFHLDFSLCHPSFDPDFCLNPSLCFRTIHPLLRLNHPYRIYESSCFSFLHCVPENCDCCTVFRVYAARTTVTNRAQYSYRPVFPNVRVLGVFLQNHPSFRMRKYLPCDCLFPVITLVDLRQQTLRARAVFSTY